MTKVLARRHLISGGVAVSLLALTLAPHIALAHTSTEAPAGHDLAVDHQIIGGADATDNPGLAVLMWKYKKDGQDALFVACSGSVVAPQWILTADHCIMPDKEKEKDRFSFRVNSLNAQSGGQLIPIDRWESKSDIKLIHLTEKITDFRPVTLGDKDPAAGSVATMYGWGATTPGPKPPPSDICKTAEVSVTGPHTDAKGGPAIGSTAKNGSGWKGDSGGPLFFQGKQVGVLSMANDMLKTNRHASVAQNLAWIQSVIAKP